MEKQKKRMQIMNLLQLKGSLWSFDMSALPENDEPIIEKALLYLDFEDMHMLFEAYGKTKVKRVWKDRLLKQGNYYSTINWLLALFFFDIKNPTAYLKRNMQ